MIHQLTGTLLHVGTSPFKGPYVVCNLGGMGLECLVLQRSLATLQAFVNQETTLHTALIVREDLLQLVGFVTPAERDLFALLQQASGVGLRTALALMDALSVSDLASAIVANNAKPLTVAKGVGPKLAQKIVLDLKEKITTFQAGRYLPKQSQQCRISHAVAASQRGGRSGSSATFVRLPPARDFSGAKSRSVNGIGRRP